ncbi:hypothetical protein Tco_0348083 [Tanacetum coccineum]
MENANPPPTKSIERFLKNFANQPHETNMNDLESDDESVDTPLVSPFPYSDNDSDDGEVLNELIEFRKSVAYFDPFLPMNIITRKAYNTIMVEGLESTGKNLVAVVRDVYVFVVSFTYITDFVVLEDIGSIRREALCLQMSDRLNVNELVMLYVRVRMHGVSTLQEILKTESMARSADKLCVLHPVTLEGDLCLNVWHIVIEDANWSYSAVWYVIPTFVSVVMYGHTPPLHVPYVAGESVVEVVDRTLQARETAIEMLKFYLKRAQDRMKMYVNRKRSKGTLRLLCFTSFPRLHKDYLCWENRRPKDSSKFDVPQSPVGQSGCDTQPLVLTLSCAHGAHLFESENGDVKMKISNDGLWKRSMLVVPVMIDTDEEGDARKKIS